MGLALYNSAQEIITDDPLRSFHDGHLGGSHQQKIYIRNDDVTRYFVNVKAFYEVDAYDDLSVYGSTGWGVFLCAGERQPSPQEWSSVIAGEVLALPNIGTAELADTSSYYPIWIKIVCPGGERAHIRENQRLVIEYDSLLVDE